MARLPYVPTGASAEVDNLYEQISGMGRPVANLYRMLANQPAALAAFLGMSRYVRSASTLDSGLRELVIIATAREFGQEYELVHHLEAARKVGVAEAKLAALEPGGNLGALTAEEQIAVDYARQSAQHRTSDDATFRRLQEHFSPESVIDLVLTSAWYHLCAVILDSTQVGLEAEHGGTA